MNVEAIRNTLLVWNLLNAQIDMNVNGIAQIPKLMAQRFTQIVLFKPYAYVSSTAAGVIVDSRSVYSARCIEQTVRIAHR